MRKGDEEQGAWAIRAISQVLLGGGIGVAVSLLFLLLCAFAISMGLFSQNHTGYLTVAACVLGGLVGGGFAVGRCKGRSLIVGTLAGVVLFLVLLTIGLILYKETALEEGGLALAAGCLCGGALAGLLGARPKKKRRK